MTTTWKNILTFFLYLAVAAVSMADPVPYNHFALISGQLSPFGVVTSTQTVPQTCEWHMFDCARPCGGRCLRPDQQCCQAEMGLYCEVNQDCHPLGCCPAGQLCDQLPGNCIDDESQHMCGSRCIPRTFECCDEAKGYFCGEGYTCGNNQCVEVVIAVQASSTLSSLDASVTIVVERQTSTLSIASATSSASVPPTVNIDHGRHDDDSEDQAEGYQDTDQSGAVQSADISAHLFMAALGLAMLHHVD